MTERLSALDILHAYSAGVFPMSESRESTELFWVDPRHRGVIPLDAFHISRSLARRLRRGGFDTSIDRDFHGVISACAERTETWINQEITALFLELHQMGFAHSVEIWHQTRLVGGVYGLALGGAFFGESMFSRQTDASKIALAYLVDRLRQGGFTLFDTQFLTEHLATLGGIEISRAAYRAQLAAALEQHADFTSPAIPQVQDLLQRNSQTSKRG